MVLKSDFPIANGGRRSGGDRRAFSYAIHLPERRSDIDRRSKLDRRRLRSHHREHKEPGRFYK